MRAARIDENQTEIVKALKDIGCTVQTLASVGHGVPDLLVGCGFNILMEVKDGSKPPSKRRLTPDQEKWHKEWKGQVVVVETVKEAIAIAMAYRPRGF